jgi:hypothetical protein
VRARLSSTQDSTGDAVINTAYIERLPATFRSRLAALARRSRAARQGTTLEAGMWLIGTVYNFCCEHRSLRLRYASGVPIGDGSNEPRSRLRASSMDALRAAELYRSSAQADRGATEMVVGSCCPCGLTTHPRLNGILPLLPPAPPVAYRCPPAPPRIPCEGVHRVRACADRIATFRT